MLQSRQTDRDRLAHRSRCCRLLQIERRQSALFEAGLSQRRDDRRVAVTHREIQRLIVADTAIEQRGDAIERHPL